MKKPGISVLRNNPRTAKMIQNDKRVRVLLSVRRRQ